MPEYRDNPKRKAEMDKLFQLSDAGRGMNEPILPPSGYTWLQTKYAQEDELEDEFGLPIPKFDWVITDDGCGRMDVKGISTLIEAISKAMEYWGAAGYRVIGNLYALRSDGKRFD